MKWLFAGLVMANLSVLGWIAARQEPAVSMISTSAWKQEGNGLVRLAELSEAHTGVLSSEGKSEPERSTETISSKQLTSWTSCWRIGGFASEEDAARLLVNFRESRAEIRLGYDSGQKESFWVLIPPVDTLESAKEIAALAVASGLGDVYVVADGRYAHSVSLGVFSARDKAVEKYEQAIKIKGDIPKAILRIVELPVRSYWIELPESSAVPEAVKVALEKNAVNLSKGSCHW